VNIIKASGESVVFDGRKIERSIRATGGSVSLSREVSGKVGHSVREGMKTDEILGLTLKYLKCSGCLAAKYDLKRAIMELGPSGFPFEEFFAQVLQNYGYSIQVGVQLKGKAINQEVDILAKKKYIHMIEAKYHNRRGIRTDTKVAMYTYARLLDLQSNRKNKIDDAWLVTNTKVTRNAQKYSSGVGLRVISWSWPRKGNLRDMIQEKGLYPITIFRSVSDSVKHKLFDLKIVLAKDLAKFTLSELKGKTGIGDKSLNKVLDEVKGLCGE